MQISVVDERWWGAPISLWENGRRSKESKQNVLGNCGTVPRNGTGVDDEHYSLCVIKMISVLDPDTWMSRDVHGLDGLLHVW